MEEDWSRVNMVIWYSINNRTLIKGVGIFPLGGVRFNRKSSFSSSLFVELSGYSMLLLLSTHSYGPC